MATKPKPWPRRALWSLEDTLALLHDISNLARETQLHAVAGDFSRIVVVSGDIREKAQTAVHLLMQARTGEFDS